VLNDGVVLLDSFGDSDIDAAWAGEDDQFVSRSCRPGPFTRRDIARRITDLQRQWGRGGPRRSFAVREAGTRRLVGGCVLEIHPDDCEIGELSYWIFPPYRCRGYATRSAELACQFAFDDLGMNRVDVLIEPTNEASLRVATRAGFRRHHHRGNAGRPGLVLFARLRGEGAGGRQRPAPRSAADPSPATTAPLLVARSPATTITP
jgi:RimJ/RimL family protein N-acetyltransferase